MTRFERMCILALVLPIVVVTAGAVWVTAGERAGFAPMAGLSPVNGAEAAALGRAGEVFRFLRAGDDPRRVQPIRPEVISSSVRGATTLEAAVWSRQLEMIQLLEREGALTAADRHPLACLAADLEVEDVAEYLSPDGHPPCEEDEALERVMARTEAAGSLR